MAVPVGRKSKMDNAADMARAERLARAEGDLASLTREVKDLRDAFKEIREDVREIRDAMREVHGGWKTVLAMLAVAGSVGSGVTLLWSKFFPHAP